MDEIRKAGLTDILGLFTQKFKPDQTMTAGDLTIKPSALKGIEYRFNITPNSTMKINKEKQAQEWQRTIENIAKYQNLFKDDPNIEVNWGKIMEVGETLIDLPGVSEFITVKDGPTQQERAMMEQIQQMQQQMQQMQQELQTKEQADQEQANSNTVTSAGVFSDPDIGGAAEQIAKL